MFVCYVILCRLSAIRSVRCAAASLSLCGLVGFLSRVSLCTVSLILPCVSRICVGGWVLGCALASVYFDLGDIGCLL